MSALARLADDLNRALVRIASRTLGASPVRRPRCAACPHCGNCEACDPLKVDGAHVCRPEYRRWTS